MTIPGKDARLTPYGSTNLGMDLALIDSLIVPNDRFFVRSNGSTPEIRPEEWTLTIDGLVESAQTIGFDRLRSLPSRTLTAFLECTGNGRSRFDPPAEGTPWANDAAGNAVWTGVPLGELFDLAKPIAGAVDVVSQGADLADMRRGLPLHVAMSSDPLVVCEMNGDPLPATHGGPVRLLVPGWAGIASTKWLTRLEVWDRPFTGEYQGNMYVLYDEDGTPVAPISQLPVKSLIRSPRQGDQLAAGSIVIDGFAWSGFAGIASVDVSIDGGETWSSASIIESAGERSWYRWSTTDDLDPGDYQIACRATDQRGIRQPRVAPWNQKGYLMNAIQIIDVQVRRADD